jgi:hypothetical protein
VCEVCVCFRPSAINHSETPVRYANISGNGCASRNSCPAVKFRVALACHEVLLQYWLCLILYTQLRQKPRKRHKVAHNRRGTIYVYIKLRSEAQYRRLTEVIRQHSGRHCSNESTNDAAKVEGPKLSFNYVISNSGVLHTDCITDLGVFTVFPSTCSLLIFSRSCQAYTD